MKERIWGVSSFATIFPIVFFLLPENVYTIYMYVLNYKNKETNKQTP
jgi:hypothetical protein